MSSRYPAPLKTMLEVPQPTADVRSLYYLVNAIRQNLNTLAGLAGLPSNRAVTFDDLITYGLLTQDQVATDPTAANAVPTLYLAEIHVPAGSYAANQVLWGHRLTRQVQFPVGFGSVASSIASSLDFVSGADAGSRAYAIQWTSDAVTNDLTSNANWGTVATATIATGKAHATFASSIGAIPLVCQAGHYLRLVCPNAADSAQPVLAGYLVGQVLP